MWVPCHHDMALPRVAGGGGDLRMWMVATNTMNKQSRTADKRWYCRLRVKRGANKSLTLKNKLIAKCHEESQDWTDSLDKLCKFGKMDMRFSTWDVRSLYGAGLLLTAAKELSKCKSDWVGVQGVEWNKGGIEQAGEYILFFMERRHALCWIP
jgi:hypothetical protein